MCTVLLPPGDNPIAVNKYINQPIKICLLYTGGRHGKDLTTFKAEGNMNLSPLGLSMKLHRLFSLGSLE